MIIDDIKTLSLYKRPNIALQIDTLNKILHTINDVLKRERTLYINILDTTSVENDPINADLVNQFEVKLVIDEEENEEVLLVNDENNNYLFNNEDQFDEFLAKQVGIKFER